MFKPLLLASSLSLLTSVFIHSTALANGALAIDGNQGDQWGFSYDHSSMSEAESQALEECGSGCSIVKTFTSGCAAYAADQTSGSTVYGWATAGSGGSAQTDALQFCRNYGGSNCIVRSWGCNSN